MSQQEDINKEENQEFTGNLILFIKCRNCFEEFDINPDLIVKCMILGQSIYKFIEYIQNSTCGICKGNKSFDKKTKEILEETYWKTKEQSNDN
jgi:hypothetical protein